MNATATIPVTSTCRAPPAPSRVYRASVSRNRTAAVTAAVCALSTRAAVAGSATAHNADTLLTGENVRSYPATVPEVGLEYRAIAPASSRASWGGRPCSRVKNSTATSVRTRARTSTPASPPAPSPPAAAVTRRATSTRNALTRRSPAGNGDPNNAPAPAGAAAPVVG